MTLNQVQESLPLIAFASTVEFSRLFPSIETPGSSAVLLPNAKAYVAVLGVGLLEFSTNLSAILAKQKFSMVLQVGIGGAFKNRGISIGDVVCIDTEYVGDLGVEDKDGSFLPWARIGGGSPQLYSGASLENAPKWLQALKRASGITVNCCTGTEELAEIRQLLFDADVESMEGAAGFAVCKAFDIPCYEIRAISNYVSTRKKSLWKISEALLALKNVLQQAGFLCA
jgi:futalosine hydrolase